MRLHLFTVTTLGLLAAACQPYSQAQYAAPQSPSATYAANYPATAYAAPASSGQVCADYGFNPGTAAFNRCVSQEQVARSSGRVNRDYSEARLNDDARTACMSYGVQPSSGWYGQCVSREVAARRYQGTTQAATYPTYQTDQYGNRVDAQGYRVDANGYRMPQQSSYVAPTYAEPQGYVQPNAGQQVSRDEFGFRYDGYGNRVDGRGNVISPRSTTP